MTPILESRLHLKNRSKHDFVQIFLAAHSRRQEDLYKVERF
jgi:hypothetical protein